MPKIFREKAEGVGQFQREGYCIKATVDVGVRQGAPGGQLGQELKTLGAAEKLPGEHSEQVSTTLIEIVEAK